MKKVICVVCVLMMCLMLAGCDSSQYKKATSLYKAGEYEAATAIFEELGDYENSPEMVKVCQYTYAAQLLQNKDYDAAKDIFTRLGDYADSQNYSRECDYQKANDFYASGEYETAISIYETISDYLDSADKIVLAKKEIMSETYGNVIKLMTEGVWFYNGGSDGVVNRLTFTNENANITQIVSDGNGLHIGESNDLSFVVDDTSIVLTLADGKEQAVPYAVENDTLILKNGYLTPEEIDADLQGYWDLRKSSSVAGIALNNESIYYFNEGKIVYESAAKALGGRNGAYYYYGPYEGTYEISEDGLKVDVWKDSQFAFNVIDGKAVIVIYGEVCTQTTGFKGEKGYRF